MEKPFYRFPIAFVNVKRKKWNPMRFLLGDSYSIPNTSKRFLKHIDLDTKDIKISNLI